MSKNEKSSVSSFDEQLDAEIEKRIAEMEGADYEFPERFGKKDYIIWAVVVVVCLVAVIAGAYI